MGTHGRRGPSRLFIGGTTECVVRHSDRPIMTLRTDAEVMDADALSHLIVPVDFSDHSEEAIRYARELAKVWNARITLLHVVEEAVLPTVYGIEPVAVFSIDHVIEQSKKALQELKVRYFDDADNVETEIVVGHAATSISDFAGEVGCDLVVISTHGLTGLKRFLMGSVTESVVRSAPCAVLTVKPFGRTLLSETQAARKTVSV
jgi:nucleotide-binding universal stress UspA family protein